MVLGHRAVDLGLSNRPQIVVLSVPLLTGVPPALHRHCTASSRAQLVAIREAV